MCVYTYIYVNMCNTTSKTFANILKQAHSYNITYKTWACPRARAWAQPCAWVRAWARAWAWAWTEAWAWAWAGSWARAMAMGLG